MYGSGRPALIGALILFLAFAGNVSMGAAGVGAPLGDVAEMLLLLSCSLLFVAGVLAREAWERNGHDRPE